jgi:hypothetical protein
MYLPKPNETSFEPPPAGSHMATCYSVIDLGTQEVEWEGQKKYQHKVRIGWELPHELMDDGRPYVVSQTYTFSMSDKAKLRHHLESWRGRPFAPTDFGPGGFDIRKLIGVGCMLNVLHEAKANGRTYANVASIMGLPKGTKAAPLVNPPVYFSLEEFDAATFESFHDKLKETIERSPEYAKATGKGLNGYGPNGHGFVPQDDMSDPIPF